MKISLLFIWVLLSINIIAQNTYQYDNLNRLIKTTYSNGSIVDYTYDQLGNRTVKQITSTPTALPDLIVQNASLGQTTISAGNSVLASCQIFNSGNGMASGNYTKLYLSSNQSFEQVSDIEIGSVYSNSVGAGISIPINTNITIPSGTNSGSWYILFLADATGQVTESNEINNMITVSLTIVSCYTMSMNFSTTSANCGLSNGSATVNVSMGYQPYSYNWSTGNSTSSISSLSAGIYYVTITDNYGCNQTSNVTVSAISPLLLITSNTPATCGLSNGTASVSVSGGTSPYAYLWNTGSTLSTLNNIPSGFYTITVIDAGLCQASTSLSVNSPANLDVTVYQTQPSCGSSNGTLSATVSGGTPPFTYQWNNSATTQTISSLASGNYSVTVSDYNNCTYITNTNLVSISENSVAPTLVTASTGTTDPGLSVNLSYSGGSLGTGAVANWYESSCGGTFIGSGNSITVYPDVSTTYYVRFEGVCNTTSCSNVNISINTYALTISSQNPSNGVTILVSPDDHNSQGNGTTQFTRYYYSNETITLTAPVSSNGNEFDGWYKNGILQSNNPVIQLQISANETIVAVYSNPQDIIILNPGWNLISLDVIPVQNTPEAVFLDIIADNNLVTVTGFQMQSGVFFDPTLPSFLNTLITLNPGEGYWVKVINTDTLFVSGDAIPSNYPIDLNAQWNLIGYWPDSTITPETAFESLISNGSLESVTGYDQGGKFFDPSLPSFLNTLTEIENSKGYWVKLDSNITDFTYPSTLNNGLVAYYPFNGNANDESGNGNDGTVNGATLVEDRFGNTEKAYLFNGANSEIEFGTWNLPLTGTLSFWINHNNTNTNPVSWVQGIFGKWSGTSSCSTQYPFVCNLNDVDKTIGFRIGNCTYTELSTPAIIPDCFNLIVIFWNEVSTSCFVNGELAVTGNSSTIPNGSQTISAGRWHGALSGYGYYSGIIDDIRIYNRNLSTNEIIELYHEGGWPLQTVDLDSGLVAYYPFNGNANDESGNGNDGTVNGATLVEDRFGNPQSAYNFAGISNPQTIKVNNSNSLQFSDAATFSVWINMNSYQGMNGWGNNVANGAHCIFAKDYDMCCIQAGIQGLSSGEFVSGIGTGSNSNWVSDTVPNSSINTWYHLAFVITTSYINIYVNGEFFDSQNGAMSFNNSNTKDLWFGRFYSYWYPFNGKMDDIRIYNRVLNEAEIQELYQEQETPQNFVCGTSTLSDYDGNIYNTVQIGNQCWMAENLSTTHYASGTAILNVTDNSAWAALADNNTDDAYCYYDNSTTNVNVYGALYTWSAAMGDNAVSSNSNPSGIQGACPTGWHLPSDNEWKQLEMQLGMSQTEADQTGYRGTDQGSQMAGNSSLWNSGNLVNNASFATSGFTALPGGGRGSLSGSFNGLGDYGNWWSSTEGNSSSAWGRRLHYDNSGVTRYNYGKSGGFSVRCLKDN